MRVLTKLGGAAPRQGTLTPSAQVCDLGRAGEERGDVEGHQPWSRPAHLSLDESLRADLFLSSSELV